MDRRLARAFALAIALAQMKTLPEAEWAAAMPAPASPATVTPVTKSLKPRVTIAYDTGFR